MKNKIKMGGTDKNITLEEAFEKFVKMKTINNLAKETIEYYRYCFKFFKEYCNKEKIFLCIEITEETFYNALEYLKETHSISSVTVNTHIRGLRAILYFFMERGYISSFKIKLIKSEKPIKEVYTDNEIEKLIEKPNIKKCSFLEFRNWAIVCYLLGTGNRLKTLRNLKVGDIDIDNMDIKLKTVKNKKPYIIPMSNSLKSVLIEYLAHRGGDEDDYLFCTQYGTQMASEGVKTAITKYNRGRGVEKRSIHLFRHTFAKNWIMSGGDILRLQKILGHSTLDMVKEYVAIFGADLKNNFDKFNPLDRHSNIINPQKIKMKKVS